VTEWVAWVAILVGLLLQTFAGLYTGTSVTEPFENVEGPIDAGVALFEALIAFLQQSWADDFPGWIQFIIAALFNIAILLLVSGNTALTIAALIAAIVAAIEAILP
jgi:hypothetical protein